MTPTVIEWDNDDDEDEDEDELSDGTCEILIGASLLSG